MLNGWGKVTICVSGYSTGTAEMQEKFGYGSEIWTLGLSLYIVSRLDAWQVQPGKKLMLYSTAWVRLRYALKQTAAWLMVYRADVARSIERILRTTASLPR